MLTSTAENTTKKTAKHAAERTHLLETALADRILVLDGAMGTALQDRHLTAQDFGGEALEGCNEILVLTRPDIIRDIHLEYLRAGCDIIETNTFGATPIVLDEYALGAKAHEINFVAAKLAREAIEAVATPTHPRFVAGSIGPTTKAISVTGGITFEELIENFRVQAKGLLEGGVDYLLLETAQDTRNIKAGLIGIDQAFADVGFEIPIAVSGTIEPMGTMLAGQSIEALYAALAHRKLLYLGLNCATGPEFMTDHIRTLAKLAPLRVACVPNAGLPDENGCYLETPEMVARVLERFLANGWVNLIGGCCGTHAGHVSALAALASKHRPRTAQAESRSMLSGVDYLEITDEMRPVIVGERTNVIGSKKFRDLIVQEKFEEASEVARAQIRGGAQLIDICLANPDRDELADMRQFLEFAVKKVRVPLMIDSTDEKVIDLALTYCQGKAIINSINLEDGEERFDLVMPLVKKYGAAVVVGTIDDDPNQGMGVSRERKLAIAERSYELLTKKWGLPEEDIYWDPLVFPCGTGDKQYVGSAAETIEGIRLIKQKYPRTKTVLGISNVSFGLPAAGREVLNSVFLYHCVQAGLDLAIVNSEKLQRFASIPEDERQVAEDLLFTRGEDPVSTFAAKFREKRARGGEVRAKLPLMDRLPRYIIEGSKDGLTADLTEALEKMKPLAIINGPLMMGMDEVGRLFNTNQLIVAEVLQSAEAMKAAVAHLEPFMEKNENASRGRVLLATVKGDVHDIGKNLVEIILANNGFEVVNLGIKVLPEQLIKGIREHKPQIVGLSGLLVKSAQQMVVTADDFAKADISTPILVGGAALTQNFVDRQISKAYPTGTVAYAKDAMNGLELAKRIVDPVRFEELKGELAARRAALASAPSGPAVEVAPVSRERCPEILIQTELPQPTDFARHVIRNTPIDQVWNYVNPLMLYGRHLGVKGGVLRELDRARTDRNLLREIETNNPKAAEIFHAVAAVKDEFRGTEILAPSAVFQFFRAEADGNTVRLFDGEATGASSRMPVAVIEFPRQPKAGGLCLADYVVPRGVLEARGPGAAPDTVAMFLTSVGRGVREMAEQLKQKGDYLKSHILQALALESAEAYAELLHSQLRKTWGFPDAPEMKMMERFQARYHGKRYSFGYPACPRLDDQATLFQLLHPTEIGVQLTEEFMMDPEASVSAMVFHHPQATYFSVGTRGTGAEDDQRQ